MKKILLIALLFISPFCHADNTTLQEIKGITSYNATILGYSVFCGYPHDQIDAVKLQFTSLIDNLKLTNDDYVIIKKEFMDTLTIARDKGPANSKMTCDTFKVEFDKIYNAISTGRAP